MFQISTLVLLDYDECAPSNLVHIQDCDKNANCTNVMGTYTCVCREGYGGDGTTCGGNSNPKLSIRNIVVTCPLE